MSLDARLTSLVQSVGQDVKEILSWPTGWTPHYPGVPVPGALYFPVNGAGSTLAVTLNRLYLVPFTVSRSVLLSSWAFEVTTAAAAGGVVRGAIYDNVTTAKESYPGAKIVDATATVASTTTGLKTFSPASPLTLLPKKIYWAGVSCQVATTTLRSRLSSDPFVMDRSAVPTIIITSAHAVPNVSAVPPTPIGSGMLAVQGPIMVMTFAEVV